MEYVLLGIYWDRTMCGKEIDFNIRQLAAIHIDDKLHTVSTFHRLDSKDSKTAKQITYMMDVSGDIIMDVESTWEEFKQWLPENVVFIVWDPEIKHIIQWHNKKFRKNPIKAQFVDLQMLQEAMFPMQESKKYVRGVMTALGLTCVQSRMLSTLYCVQCMLRLYRKLWKEGRKFLEQHEWEDLLLRGDFSELQQMKFFSEMLTKNVQAECRSMIKDFCQEKRYKLRVKGTVYEIDADQAVWRFDLMNGGADLEYIPRQYVQLPHCDMKIEEQELSVVKVLPEIFKRINNIEDRLKYGVGSVGVEEILKRLCDFKCS